MTAYERFIGVDVAVGYDRGNIVDRAAIVVMRREPDGTLTVIDSRVGEEADAVIAWAKRLTRLSRCSTP